MLTSTRWWRLLPLLLVFGVPAHGQSNDQGAAQRGNRL